MERIDLHELTREQATLLMPLWARAVETRSPDPILRDARAEEIVERLGFDFDRFVSSKVSATEYCIRSSIIDELARAALSRSPSRTVIEFGPGLDTRFERLDDGMVRWIDIDLPDAMRLRQRFFEATERRTMITASVTDQAWVSTAQRACGDAPPLFIAEGVFYFLDTGEVRSLLATLAEHFPGSSLIFDAQSPVYLWYCNRRHPLRDSRLRFSVRNARQLERWDRRFRVERYVGFGDRPYYDRLMRRLPIFSRLARRAFPPIRHFFKIVQMQLGQAAGAVAPQEVAW